MSLQMCQGNSDISSVTRSLVHYPILTVEQLVTLSWTRILCTVQTQPKRTKTWQHKLSSLVRQLGHFGHLQCDILLQ